MELPDITRARVSSKKTPNLDEFRLRNFLDKLDRHGELLYNDDPVELIDIARLLESDPRAICFRNIGARGEQLVGNVMATRKRLALALNIPDRKLLVELRRRLANPIAPIEVAPSDAPVQEIVWEGNGSHEMHSRRPKICERQRWSRSFNGSSTGAGTMLRKE